MPSYTAVDPLFAKKVKAVKTYLGNGESLRKSAHSFGISYLTLWRWVKRYKVGGAEALKTKKNLYKMPWKRSSRDIEEKVMFLKEQNSSLSIRRARQLLHRAGITISNKGIWGIWKRYGLIKKSIQNPLSRFGISTPESEDGIRRAKMFIRDGDLKSAARILNDIPCLPEDPIILEIPDKFLSLRRKLDRLCVEIGEIPYPEYLRKIRRVGKVLERKGYVYSSIIANFLELTALINMKKPQEQSRTLSLLARKMRKVKESPLWFLFLVQRAANYCYLRKIRKGLDIVKECRRFVHRLPFPYYWSTFGALLTTFGRFKEAFLFFKKASEKEKNLKDFERFVIYASLHGHAMAGEYSSGNKMLVKVTVLQNSLDAGGIYYLARAYMSFGQNKLTDAAKFFLESLEKASQNQLHNILYATSVGLASVANTVNKKNEAKTYLRKYLWLMKRDRLVAQELILKSLLGSVKSIPKEFRYISPFYLLNLLLQARHTMKICDYRKTYNYAKRHGLMGLFHRWIVFFPEPVLHVLEKGKPTGLPKTILRFPVFDQKIPVYHIKFLGHFIVSKNQKYLKTRLTPKEKAFLIHLALKAGESGKFILLKELYQNFWPGRKNPSNQLLHLLTSLKKKLNLSGYLLGISAKHYTPKLTNRGIYFTTDYGEFVALLFQIETLEAKNEWRLARKEYLRAFRLFHGEPFEKMYDGWSENMRGVILNQLKVKAINFAKGCLEHNNIEAPRLSASIKKVLENISRITSIGGDGA